jgi:hypothetical protein
VSAEAAPAASLASFAGGGTPAPAAHGVNPAALPGASPAAKGGGKVSALVSGGMRKLFGE